MAIDDHVRYGSVQMHKDERKDSAVPALEAAVTHYEVTRLLTDNGSATAPGCLPNVPRRGIKHTFSKPYRPQTDGKAERFIQACLRE